MIMHKSAHAKKNYKNSLLRSQSQTLPKDRRCPKLLTLPQTDPSLVTPCIVQRIRKRTARLSK